MAKYSPQKSKKKSQCLHNDLNSYRNAGARYKYLFSTQYHSMLIPTIVATLCLGSGLLCAFSSLTPVLHILFVVIYTATFVVVSWLFSLPFLRAIKEKRMVLRPSKGYFYWKGIQRFFLAVPDFLSKCLQFLRSKKWSR